MRAAEPGRLVRRALDWDLSPADVLRRVRADPHPVALLGAWAGGSDIVASDPVRTCCAPEPCTDVLAEPMPDLPGPGFGGGWLGYLGFGLAGQVLPVPPPPGEPRRLPPGGSATTTTCCAATGPPAGGRSRPCGRPAVPPRWSAASASSRAGPSPAARLLPAAPSA